MPSDDTNQTPPTTSTTSKSGSTKSRKFPTLLIVLIIVFVVLVGAFIITRPTKEDKNAVSAAQVALVSISKKGFTPATLNVKSGTTVIWDNQDKKTHQVAADPYPKNDSIPGMNSTVILNNGDTYSFKFSQAGTYTYHDQKNPTSKLFHGVVVVQ